MNSFTSPLQAVSQYDHYPHLWQPDLMPSLFLVKVPPSIRHLDEQTYKILMQQRIAWMIQQWMADHSQLETQRLLATKLSELHSYQEYPIIDQDETEDETAALNRWREAWAETLIFYNETFTQAIALLGVNFSTLPLTTTHPEFQEFLELHQETNLEEWLNDLSAYA
jgi:hypothetical protein